MENKITHLFASNEKIELLLGMGDLEERLKKFFEETMKTFCVTTVKEADDNAVTDTARLFKLCFHVKPQMLLSHEAEDLRTMIERLPRHSALVSEEMISSIKQYYESLCKEILYNNFEYTGNSTEESVAIFCQGELCGKDNCQLLLSTYDAPNHSAQKEMVEHVNQAPMAFISLIVTCALGILFEYQIKKLINTTRFNIQTKLTGRPQISTVIDEKVSIFEQECSQSKEVGRLFYGDKVEIIGNSEYWYKVEFLNPLNEVTTGYIPNRSVDYYIQ